MTFRFGAFDSGNDDHVDAAYAIVSDWEVVRQLSAWPWPPDRAYTAERLSASPAEGHLASLWESEALIGMGGIVEGRLGLMVGRQYWRRGAGWAICKHLIERAFAAGESRVRSDVWEDNATSHALHLRLGFRETGRDLKCNAARGGEMISVNYELALEEWKASQ